MSILLLPHNIPDSLKHLSTLIDDIWYYAGDRSTDVRIPLHFPSSVFLVLSYSTSSFPFSHSHISPLSASPHPLPALFITELCHCVYKFVVCYTISLPLGSQMNWYTRRVALTGVYNTTELVMLQDSSPDFQDTWTFLDKRIQDIINMANTAKQVLVTCMQTSFHFLRFSTLA